MVIFLRTALILLVALAYSACEAPPTSPPNIWDGYRQARANYYKQETARQTCYQDPCLPCIDELILLLNHTDTLVVMEAQSLLGLWLSHFGSSFTWQRGDVGLNARIDFSTKCYKIRDYLPDNEKDTVFFDEFKIYLDSIFIRTLPCGVTAMPRHRFPIQYPILRDSLGSEYYTSELYYEMLRTYPEIDTLCACWKTPFDEIRQRFPKLKMLQLYDLYCIKRDTLLSECDERGLYENSLEELTIEQKQW